MQATPWLSSRVVKSSNCPPTPCAIRNPRRRTPNRVATVSGMVCCRKSDTFATEVAVCGVPCVSLHGPDPSSCAKQRSIAISLMATPAEVGARRRNAPPAAAVAELYAGPTVGCRAYARPRPAPALRSGADRGLSGARCPARVLPSRWSRRWVIGGAMLRPPPGPVRLRVRPPKDLDLRRLSLALKQQHGRVPPRGPPRGPFRARLTHAELPVPSNCSTLSQKKKKFPLCLRARSWLPPTAIAPYADLSGPPERITSPNTASRRCPVVSYRQCGLRLQSAQCLLGARARSVVPPMLPRFDTVSRYVTARNPAAGNARRRSWEVWCRRCTSCSK